MTSEDKGDEIVVPEKQEKTAPATAQRHPVASLTLATGVVALVAAIVCTGYFAYAAVNAYFFESSTVTVRDESVDAAEQAVLNVTSVDAKDTKGWQKRVEASLTGNAKKQINDEVISKLQQQVAAAGNQNTKVTSRITQAAATSVDVDNDTAKVLVFAKVSSQTADAAQATTVPMNFLVTVVNVDGTRKASEIVPLTGIAYQEGGN